MSKLETQGGEVFFSNVYHSLPVVEPVVRQNVQVLGQAQPHQDLVQLWHCGTGRGKDRHDVSDVWCLRRWEWENTII